MINFTKKIFVMMTFLAVGNLAFSQTPFWTEEFDGQIPADWAAVEIAGDMSASSNWIWTDVGPAGAYATDAIASTTAGNGWVVFDSDLNCSGEQNVWLVSPKLDLSDRDMVFLQFETYYRRFNDTTLVQVSTDSTNWTSFAVFNNVQNNAYGDGSADGATNPQVIELDLTSVAANQGEVWFAFHFKADATTVAGGTLEGCGYSWQVDDIALYEEDPGGVVGVDYLWGGPDDPNGSFDGGLNDWTNNAISDPAALWIWDAEGDAANGAFWGTLPPIASPSVANGAAVFDSDFYDNDGDQMNLGGGAVPAPHVSELISPIIDMSNNTNISLEFNQFYRNFQSATFIAWSNDGGNSWSDLIQVNENVPVNEATAPDDVQTIPLFGAGGTDEFRVKFVFDGEYYFWIVDDVRIINSADFDLALGDFFYPPASYAQPVSQIDTDTMGFSVDVSNLGAAAQTDISVKAMVLEDGGAVLFETELIIPELAPATVDSTFALPDQFVPENLEVGAYKLRYEISSVNDDIDDSDNMVEEQFLVTEDLYSKENGDAAQQSAFQPGGGGDFWVGNLYQTSANLVDEYVANTVTFSLAASASDPMEGKTVSLYLMRVKDDVDANWDNFDDQVTDVLTHPNLELIGLADHTFTTEGSYEAISVQMLDFEYIEPGVPLDPGARYFIMIAYLDEANTLFHTFNQEIDYFQISTVVVSNMFFLGGFGEENAAYLRMDIALANPNDVDGRILPEEVMTFFPNPVSDRLNVEVNFEEPVLANVTLADQNGRVILIDELPNTTQALKQYDVSSLPAGTYIVRVATEEGTLTKQFVVVR